MTTDIQRSLLEQTKEVAPGQPLRVLPELINKVMQGDKASVLSALQSAVELEHSTIPPYLYALYSLDATKNGVIAGIIQSIVVEEMLHMTLACNILNALGGAPAIDTPTFIPTYPGTLPGIEPPYPGWEVRLKPFSKDVVQTIFMQIEMPEDPQDYPVRTPQLEQSDVSTVPRTIGAFYLLLKQQIIKLGDGAFVFPTPNQVGPDIMFESIVVHDVKSACAAIDLIVDQGEGTDLDPFDDEDEPAHYYRFAEIIKGRELITIPGDPPKYEYAGAEVVVDESGIWNVEPDRTSSHQAVRTFNYTYTNLLKALHALFNGQNNQQQFKTALGLMMSLKQQSKDMMSTLGCGPSFVYEPTNPGSPAGD
jgi:hypothetical protein